MKVVNLKKTYFMMEGLIIRGGTLTVHTNRNRVNFTQVLSNSEAKLKMQPSSQKNVTATSIFGIVVTM